MYGKNKCWMCKRIKELTEHHIVPQSLRRLVPKLNKHTVDMCAECHAKVHILLPKFFEDGSYRWNGDHKWNVIVPHWEDWSKDKILEWDGDGNGKKINGNGER